MTQVYCPFKMCAFNQDHLGCCRGEVSLKYIEGKNGEEWLDCPHFAERGKGYNPVGEAIDFFLKREETEYDRADVGGDSKRAV